MAEPTVDWHFSGRAPKVRAIYAFDLAG